MDITQNILNRLARLEAISIPLPVWLAAPLTSTSFDGDSFSTTGKTLIDLSVEFGVPDGISAVLLFIFASDSGSLLSTTAYFDVSPNDIAGSTAGGVGLQGIANNAVTEGIVFCPCDGNGDIYYQNTASGVLTTTVHIEIWGYFL